MLKSTAKKPALAMRNRNQRILSLSLSLSQLVIKSTVGMSFFLTLAFNAMFLTNENRARIANEGATISRNVLRY